LPMIHGMGSSYCFHRKKPNNTIGRPLIPFGKVLDGINSTCTKNRASMEDAAKRI
jgi:hypothetical protein